jgi:predicted peroxiredoxin
MKKLLALLGIAAIAGVALLPAATRSSDGKESLFVNLTSDEIHRVAMALTFAERVRTERDIPVTVFLNVDGARLADPEEPQPCYADGRTPQRMIRSFLEAGGTVVLCPMCMKNVAGLEADEILEGIVLGTPENTLDAMFAEGARVMSY